MKKKIFASLLLMAFTGMVGVTNAETTSPYTGSISVNKTQMREILPNVAQVSLAVETSGKTLKEATDANKKITNDVTLTVKALLGSEDYLRTADYSANPSYIYTKNNKKVIDKFVVKNNVVINTKNVKLLPKIIDTAISNGATNVNNVEFIAINYDNACNMLLSEITKKAHSQANSIATSIGSKVVGVKHITTSCSLQNNNSTSLYKMNLKSTGAEDMLMGASILPETNIEIGKVNITATINAEFFVK